MDILQSYSFHIVALGTMLLAAAAGMVGCLNLYKGQSLIGDAVGHSSFPGVVLIFMLMQTRNPGVLLLGAMFSGALAYLLIQLAKNHSKINLDACLAIFLSGFFGLGMVLKSIIQGNPRFSGAPQSGLENYIFGQASYMLEADVKWIALVAVICMALLLIFFKEWKVYVFDPEYARTIGLPHSLMHVLLLLMTIALIGVGLKAVGAILISSLLILPCVAANQWSRRFSRVLAVSAFTGAVSAFVGTWLSSLPNGPSTGPAIIMIAGGMALISMVIGPFGFIRRLIKRRAAR